MTALITNLGASPAQRPENIVLVGLESVGKSALFRQLTGHATGDETNFRGSTVVVRTAPFENGFLVDTPGIRFHDDTETTRQALAQADAADRVVLVVRGTHLHRELQTLLAGLDNSLRGRRVAVVVTFEDKLTAAGNPADHPATAEKIDQVRRQLRLPVALVNARELALDQRRQLTDALDNAVLFATHNFATENFATQNHSIPTQPIQLLPAFPVHDPAPTWFEKPGLGPWLGLAALLLLFGAPVWIAYQIAQRLEPFVEATILEPLTHSLSALENTLPLLHAVLVGDYGLLTLGWYSFLWAFPVVLLIGISVAATEESGLKDRITAALDPWLRRIGLSGRDLIPVLSGFGCNVVAVFQSRACSRCTRSTCVSLIAFGSACSYQIGASLSIFGSAGMPWLFLPYLTTLFFVGAIHTRLWHGKLSSTTARPPAERAFLQLPSTRGIGWRVRGVLRQFIREAMPIFLLMCIAGALLDEWGWLARLAQTIGPHLAWLGLPADTAPGLIFSIVRKDGLLVLNQGQGALLATLSASQVFILVYLASTVTACLVTLWTISRELGAKTAGILAGRQALTALISTGLLSLVIALFEVGFG